MKTDRPAEPARRAASGLRAALPLLGLLLLGACTRQTSAPAEVRVSGNIEAVDAQLGFKIPGRVVERLVSEGQSVAVGQPIARLDDTDQKDQLALRRTDLALTILGFNQALRGVAADLNDLWKRSLVLQDCHLQWLLADVGAHYLPLARELEAETRERLAGLGSGLTTSDSRLATAPILNPEPRNLPPPHSPTQGGPNLDV